MPPPPPPPPPQQRKKNSGARRPCARVPRANAGRRGCKNAHSITTDTRAQRLQTERATHARHLGSAAPTTISVDATPAHATRAAPHTRCSCSSARSWIKQPNAADRALTCSWTRCCWFLRELSIAPRAGALHLEPLVRRRGGRDDQAAAQRCDHSCRALAACARRLACTCRKSSIGHLLPRLRARPRAVPERHHAGRASAWGAYEAAGLLPQAR